MRKFISVLFLGWISLAGAAPLPAKFLSQRPKLVLVLVIDQFRADYLTRYFSRFLPARQGAKPGGFRYLMESGAYFPNGQYALLQNMTGPGHATILTGAYAYQFGIPINTWYEDGARRYCAADADGTRSPRALLASTVGDELKGFSPRSRVVTLALKDRAAILLGGHRADLALWFDTDHYRWESSSFYVGKKPLPGWVTALNTEMAPEARALATGTEEEPAKHSTDVAWEGTPKGIEVTEQVAERAIAGYRLGAGPAADLLAVSFSSHDHAGHHHALGSPEMEAMTVAEDRQLAKLFEFTAKHVPGGMKNVVVVLTADHGIVENPDTLRQAGVSAGRVDSSALRRTVEERLTKKFGKSDQPWIAYEEDLNFYFDTRTLADRGGDRAAVEAEARAALQTGEGIAEVFTRGDYDARRFPPGELGKQVERTYFPGRSGDLVAILKPFHIPVASGVTHLTGYAYDRTVPILFAGGAVRPGVHPEEASVVDIAPTLAFLLGTVPPSQCEGKVLNSIF